MRGAVLLLLLVGTLTDPILSHSSVGCIYNEETAACDTINLQPFKRHIFNLKILSPKDPLDIKNQTFNVTGLEYVSRISIVNATISNVHGGAFGGLPLLSIIDITNSNISKLDDPLILSNATNLRNLRIANSTLHSFQNIKSVSLQELDLSGNKFTHISKKSFVNLPSLTYLNLANNHIATIELAAFKSLSYLQEIVLSNNNITSLDYDLFANNSELVSLILDHNPLKTLDLNIVSDLEKLSLKSCKLKEFKVINNDFSLLSYLDLSHNEINFTSNIFHDMENLEYLDLSNNNISNLPSHTFKSNYRLQRITLDNNKFAYFPKLVCQYGNFEVYSLSCKNCQITEIPIDTFKYFPSLLQLNLANNRITDKSLASMQYLPNLKDLNLSYNNISVVKQLGFRKSSALERVNFSHNPLRVLDSSIFFNNRALKTLDVSFCKLVQLWKQPSKYNITSLMHLNLANNSIHRLSSKDLQVTPSIKDLDVSGNPLECDPTLRDTITWLTTRKVSPIAVKTHESAVNMHDDLVFEDADDDSWSFLAEERCNTDYFDKFEDYEKDNELVFSHEPHFNDVEELGHRFDEERENNEHLEFDESEFTLELLPVREKRSRYFFLWPTLVFVFTALSVLVIAVNVMLLMLRNRMIPRNVNLPHIKMPQWNSNGKVKKHIGTVYQSLSEDKSGPTTPIISRKYYVPTHNDTPKSVIYNTP